MIILIVKLVAAVQTVPFVAVGIRLTGRRRHMLLLVAVLMLERLHLSI